MTVEPAAPGIGTATTVREAHFPADTPHVARLVGDYLLQTEREKAEHGLAPVPVEGDLPERYQAEVDDPATAFATATVLLAERDGVLDGRPVGVVVVAMNADGSSGEIKRFWVDPEHRGVGAGRSLLEAATARVDGPAWLSVWRWRSDAIAAYERLGLVEVPTWETREELLCMERAGSAARAVSTTGVVSAAGTERPVHGEPVTARRPQLRRWVRRIALTVVVVIALLVASFLVTEKLRSIAARDIEEILSAIPGMAAGDVDVSYSNDPFSTGVQFRALVPVGPGTDMAAVSDALVDAMVRWRESPLADDAVSTSIDIFTPMSITGPPSSTRGGLHLSGWDLSEAQLVAQLAYWDDLYETLDAPVSIRFSARAGDPRGTVTADLPAATQAPADLADRLEQAAFITPPHGTWTWMVNAPTGTAEDAAVHSLTTVDSPPSPATLELLRDLAAIPHDGLGAPSLWVRINEWLEPGTEVMVSFPAVPPAGTSGETAGEPFVDGPAWGGATAYADLVHAAGQETRLGMSVGEDVVADLAPGACGDDPTPAQRIVEDALLAHLGTTRADYC